MPAISLREAADRLGVHYMTVYRYVRTGRLAAVREGTEWRVQTQDVDHLRNGTEPARRRPRGSRGAARARLEARLIAGDEAGAWLVVESALASGASPSEIYLLLLVPSLAAIGDRWEAGDLTVADEHRATVVAQRLVGRLGPRMARRGRKRGTIVLGAVAGEEHALPGAILADLIRGAGFDVVDLGPNTPTDSFVDAARERAASSRSSSAQSRRDATPTCSARLLDYTARESRRRSWWAARASPTRNTPGDSEPTAGLVTTPSARCPRSKPRSRARDHDRVEGDDAGIGARRRSLGEWSRH